MTESVRSVLIVLFLSVACALGCVPLAHAQTAADIQVQIEASNQQIEQLQADIAQLQTQLDATSQQKQTLQSAVQEIDLNIQKLTKSVTLTQAQITQKDSEISNLSGSITDTAGQITASKEGIGDSLRALDVADTQSQLLVLLSGGSLSSFFDETTDLAALRVGLQDKVRNLSTLKDGYETDKDVAQDKRQELAALQSQLNNQKQGLAISRDAQNKLLADTKNKESTYQAQIAEKKAQETAFENTLSQLQAQLKPVGTGTIPQTSPGVLAWPFPASVMATCPAKAKALGNSKCITQYFGTTDFSTANPQVYNNMGHDGLDIGVPVGTPILAALGGTVLAVGNTDIKAPNGQMCYSFGKWVMLSHPNGLDTLYAHLSDNTIVKAGQTVTAGQLIGYSGMTGYATGPHLHFGVYAAAGVKIMDLGEWRGSTGTPCTSAGAVLPVAPTNAYLNPLSYLPPL